MKAKEIMAEGFIGFEEIIQKAGAMKLDSGSVYSLDRFPIPYTTDQLKEFRKSHFLFFVIPFHNDGTPVTILSLRNIFGCDPSAMEPCFYNQDWYLKEDFVNRPLEPGWYLIGRALLAETRGKRVDEIKAHPANGNGLPSAVLCTYFFFYLTSFLAVRSGKTITSGMRILITKATRSIREDILTLPARTKMAGRYIDTCPSGKITAPSVF